MNWENCDGFIPKCKKCGGMVRPDVVLYEEQLDDYAMSAAIKAIKAADFMIVGGTSLVVYPAAGLLRILTGEASCLSTRAKRHMTTVPTW